MMKVKPDFMIMISAFFWSKFCHVYFKNTVVIFLLLVFHCFVVFLLSYCFIFIVRSIIFCSMWQFTYVLSEAFIFRSIILSQTHYLCYHYFLFQLVGESRQQGAPALIEFLNGTVSRDTRNNGESPRSRRNNKDGEAINMELVHHWMIQRQCLSHL
jgi:hypothetical protein